MEVIFLGGGSHHYNDSMKFFRKIILFMVLAYFYILEFVSIDLRLTTGKDFFINKNKLKILFRQYSKNIREFLTEITFLSTVKTFVKIVKTP